MAKGTRAEAWWGGGHSGSLACHAASGMTGVWAREDSSAGSAPGGVPRALGYRLLDKGPRSCEYWG